MRKPPTFNSLQQALIQIGNRCNQKSLTKRPISTTLTYLTRSGSGLGARRFKSSRPINRFQRYSPVDFMGERVVDVCWQEDVSTGHLEGFQSTRLRGVYEAFGLRHPRSPASSVTVFCFLKRTWKSRKHDPYSTGNSAPNICR